MAKKKTKKKKGATPTNPSLYSRVKSEAKKSLKFILQLMLMDG